MNKVIITGRLTKKPDLRQTGTGIAVVSTSIAVDSGYGDKKTTDFFDITAWRGTAETISKYCDKGSKLAIVGELHNRNWTDNNGNKRTTANITVSDFEFLDTKGTKAENTEPAYDELDDDEDVPF